MRVLLLIVSALVLAFTAEAGTLKAAAFSVDVTPPMGAPLCGGSVPPVAGVDDPLHAKGLVLLPEGQDPIVLCAVDWIGIANEGYDAWREALAEAAGTSPSRVAVHTLHQHDAPFCDFTTEDLAAEIGLGGRKFDVDHAWDSIRRVAQAVREAKTGAEPITHIGTGAAQVYGVASNRRIIGEDGKVQHVRWTAVADPEVRAFPVGVIDPMARVVSLWNGDKAVAVLSYYATHPQSYYRTGMVSCDFVGIARNTVEAEVGAPWIHFDGAGGNIGAGKYNDGSKENRPVLADRLAKGFRAAWDETRKSAVSSADVAWNTEDVLLPPRSEVTLEEERATLLNENEQPAIRLRAAREVAWLERLAAGKTIPIGLLRIGPAAVLHMPGELFVEYQLAGEFMRPDLFVCMAAYGDYAPGYIGTRAAYPQGGYECQLRVSRTAPEVEDVLTNAMATLLDVDEVPIIPSQFTLAETLFTGQDLQNWYTWLRDRGRDDDPLNVFTVNDGILRISGEEWGGITTNDEFDRYHLITEWKWTGKAYPPREDKTLDSGILVHSVGEDGGYSGVWMHSIECQIIEGGTGDFIVVGDGSDNYSVTCLVSDEMQGSSHVYDPEGKPVTINRGRINWWGRDPGWVDEIGFRGEHDVEHPVGQWNRLECIVDRGIITYILNGVVVNAAIDANPKRGRIQIQSESAEILFRRIDLLPLR